MRRQFIMSETIGEAWDRAPWAAIINKVDGGWMAFESIDEWRTWRTQK